MEERKRPMAAALFSVGVIAIISLPSQPTVSHVVAGFFPLLFSLVIGVSILRRKKYIPPGLAIGIPLLLSLLLVLLGWTYMQVFKDLSGWLAVINAIAGIGVMTILTGVFAQTPLSYTPSHLKKHVDDVVQSVHVVNSAIERVYSHANGADASLRNRLLFSHNSAEKIEKLLAEEQYKEAHQIIYDLYEQLRRLFEIEQKIFGRAHLRNLSRDHHGASRIVDVLIANESVPVREYVDKLTYALQSLNAEMLGMKKKKN